MVEQQTLPGSLLLAGTQGVGKMLLARFVAAQLNPGYEEQIWSNTCSDVITVGDLWQKDTLEDWGRISQTSNFDQAHRTGKGGAPKRSNTIGIEDVQSFVEKLHHIPTAPAKVCIIQDADRLTTPGANALLKIIEEPPHKTYFILTTTHPDRLLTTIVSRCQTLRVPPTAPEQVEQLLAMFGDLPPERRQHVEQWAGGRLLYGYKLLSDDDFYLEQSEAWRNADAFVRGDAAQRLQLVTEWQALDESALRSQMQTACLAAQTLFEMPGQTEKVISLLDSLQSGLHQFRQNANKKLVLTQMVLACDQKNGTIS